MEKMHRCNQENLPEMSCCELELKGNEWRTLYQTENFFVMPTIGGMGFTYLLVVSKGHFPGVGGTPPRLYSELLDTMETTKRVMKEAHGHEPLMFEHGPFVSGVRGGGCLDHMHIHVVDAGDVTRELAGDLTDHLRLQGDMYRMDCVPEFERLPDIIERKKSSYFWVQVPDDGRRLVTEVRVNLPSQFIRQIIARANQVEERYGAGAWDWAAYPDIETLHRTLERLDGKF